MYFFVVIFAFVSEKIAFQTHTKVELLEHVLMSLFFFPLSTTSTLLLFVLNIQSCFDISQKGTLSIPNIHGILLYNSPSAQPRQLEASHPPTILAMYITPTIPKLAAFPKT